MPTKSSKKKALNAATSFTASGSTLNLQRAGMPAADSIVKVLTPQAPLVAALAAKKGAKAAKAAAAPAFAFRIIRTNEVDGYEQAATPQGTLVAAATKAAKKASKKSSKKAGLGPEDFDGTARKAAKLSLSTARTKTYKDLRTLINTLPSHETMAKRTPPISKGATSGRVAEEERNVRVRTFLYAASREDDRDFHLILGRDPKLTPELYMTMELSGLPPQGAASFARLKTAREAFKAFFSGPGQLPGTSYDFYDPPIPVEIEGSLFWDASHATGTRPGPKSLKNKMPTVWEVHPISKIRFNP